MKSILAIWRAIKGYKTITLNAIAFLIGLWEMIGESGLYELLCAITPTMCNIEETAFYAGGIAVVAILNKALRFITNSPIFKS